jgi:hypothetical protein
MTTVYSFPGWDEDARIEAAEVLRTNPKFSLEKWEKRCTYEKKTDCERAISALRKARLKQRGGKAIRFPLNCINVYLKIYLEILLLVGQRRQDSGDVRIRR